MNIAARFEQTSFDSESLDLASHPRSEESRMAVDRDGLSPSLCRSAEPSILLCVLRRPCRSCSLARSLAAGCSNFSVRPSAPSVPPSLRCSAVRGCARVLPLHRSSIRRLLVIPCVCSLAVSVERPSAREGGREGGPAAADAARLPPLTPLPFSFPTK